MMYAQAQDGEEGAATDEPTEAKDDNVVDAEFEDVDEKK